MRKKIEHLMICRLYRGLLCAIKRIGLITIPEGEIIRLDYDTVFRRLPDGGRIFGPPLCWKRWVWAWDAVCMTFTISDHLFCKHNPGPYRMHIHDHPR